jgi:hypothetical protein
MQKNAANVLLSFPFVAIFFLFLSWLSSFFVHLERSHRIRIDNLFLCVFILVYRTVLHD